MPIYFDIGKLYSLVSYLTVGKFIKELYYLTNSMNVTTIAYGSILYSKVIDISFDYSLQIPLGILGLLAADFDGDVLNVLLIINEEFRVQAERILSARNAMFISKNDGKLASNMIANKDTTININSLISMSRTNYTQDQIDQINRLKAM